jgi:hypothetical protein
VNRDAGVTLVASTACANALVRAMELLARMRTRSSMRCTEPGLRWPEANAGPAVFADRDDPEWASGAKQWKYLRDVLIAERTRYKS